MKSTIGTGNLVCRQSHHSKQDIHFSVGKTEKREAELTNSRTGSFVRFHWLDDEEKKSYFELRIVYNELTEDLMLEITDWAEPDEKEDIIDLWESDIDKLKRVSGL